MSDQYFGPILASVIMVVFISLIIWLVRYGNCEEKKARNERRERRNR